MTKHWHYMNGSAGCLPDSHERYSRKRDAIEWAERIFGDALCDSCYRSMARELRSRGFEGSHVFDRSCTRSNWDSNTCYAGADVVKIFSCTDSECMKGEGIS